MNVNATITTGMEDLVRSTHTQKHGEDCTKESTHSAKVVVPLNHVHRLSVLGVVNAQSHITEIHMSTIETRGGIDGTSSRWHR